MTVREPGRRLTIYDDLIDTGTVVVDDVEIIRYLPSRSRGDSG